MKISKDMICIVCPIGCDLHVEAQKEGWKVTGNKCPRGEKYAIEEMTEPKRVVTSTVTIVGGIYPVIPVKTKESIPKEKIFEVMRLLSDVKIIAPVRVGQVVVENIAETGVDIIATRDMEKKEKEE